MVTQSWLADLLLMGIILIMLVHAFILYRQKRFLLLDPLNAFWAGSLICYVLQPFSHSEVFRSWYSDSLFEETLFWVLFGLCFVILGYESRIGQKWGRKIPKTPRHLNPNGLNAMGMILVALGFIGYAYLVSTAGSLEQWLSVGRGGTDWAQVSGYIAILHNLLPVGIMLLLFHVELHDVPSLKRIIVWIAGFLMLLWFIYLGTRSRTIGFSILMLAVYYLPRRKNPPYYLAIGLFLLLIPLTSFQANYRGNFTNLSFNLDKIDMEEAKQKVLPAFLLEKKDQTNIKEVSRGIEFGCVLTIVDLVPQQVSYNYGYGFLEFFTRPIPRAIWPDKIYPQMEAAFPILYYGNLSGYWVPTSTKPLLAGPAFTFVGYWYAVGGAIGLIIGGFFTGCLLRMIRSLFDRSPGNEADVILFSVLVIIGFKEAASTPLNWLYTLPFGLLPLIILFYLNRRYKPSKSSKLISVRKFNSKPFGQSLICIFSSRGKR